MFSISKPFRQPIYTNLWFTFTLILLTVFSGYVILSNEEWVTSLMVFEPDVSTTFRLWIVLIIVVNAIASYGYEKIAVWYISQWWKRRKDRLKQARMQRDI